MLRQLQKDLYVQVTLILTWGKINKHINSITHTFHTIIIAPKQQQKYDFVSPRKNNSNNREKLFSHLSSKSKILFSITVTNNFPNTNRFKQYMCCLNQSKVIYLISTTGTKNNNNTNNSILTTGEIPTTYIHKKYNNTPQRSSTTIDEEHINIRERKKHDYINSTK